MQNENKISKLEKQIKKMQKENAEKDRQISKLSSEKAELLEIMDTMNLTVPDVVNDVAGYTFGKWKLKTPKEKMFEIGVLLYGFIFTAIAGFKSPAFRNDVVEALSFLWGVLTGIYYFLTGIVEKITSNDYILFIASGIIIMLMAYAVAVILYNLYTSKIPYLSNTTLCVIFIVIAVLVNFADMIAAIIPLNLVAMFLLITSAYFIGRRVVENYIRKHSVLKY